MPAFTEHSIAPGWNNVGSLTKIGLIVATSNIAFPEPSGAQQGFTPGTVKQRMDLLLTTVGFNREVWGLYNITYPQYRYALATWCAGGFSGKVTVRTRWQENAYANYNAILNIQHEGLESTQQGYRVVTFTFFDLRVIT